jgi:hypothetical protein
VPAGLMLFSLVILALMAEGLPAIGGSSAAIVFPRTGSTSCVGDAPGDQEGRIQLRCVPENGAGLDVAFRGGRSDVNWYMRLKEIRPEGFPGLILLAVAVTTGGSMLPLRRRSLLNSMGDWWICGHDTGGPASRATCVWVNSVRGSLLAWQSSIPSGASKPASHTTVIIAIKRLCTPGPEVPCPRGRPRPPLGSRRDGRTPLTHSGSRVVVRCRRSPSSNHSGSQVRDGYPQRGGTVRPNEPTRADAYASARHLGRPSGPRSECWRTKPRCKEVTGTSSSCGSLGGWPGFEIAERVMLAGYRSAP